MIIRMLHYSGAPKMFLWVADQLAKRGNHVTILTWSENSKVTIPQNVTLRELDLGNHSLIGKVKAIRKVVKEIEPSVSISFLLDSNVFNIFACRGLKTKSIVCERNDPFKPRYYKLKVLRPLFRWADGAVFQLPKVAEYYSNIKGKTAVISNPIASFNGIIVKPFLQREKIITTLGRLDIQQKRTDLLVDAFSQFTEDYPDYKLRLWGDGPDEDKLKSLVKEKSLEDKVEFAGKTNTPIESIKDSRVFVLTSDYEGIPNALMEAMSIGLPCISTDCRPGGAALLIKDKTNGHLVPKGSVSGIVEALKSICSNPEYADRLGENAKKISSRFSEDTIGNMWDEYVHKYEI